MSTDRNMTNGRTTNNLRHTGKAGRDFLAPLDSIGSDAFSRSLCFTPREIQLGNQGEVWSDSRGDFTPSSYTPRHSTEHSSWRGSLDNVSLARLLFKRDSSVDSSSTRDRRGSFTNGSEIQPDPVESASNDAVQWLNANLPEIITTCPSRPSPQDSVRPWDEFNDLYHRWTVLADQHGSCKGASAIFAALQSRVPKSGIPALSLVQSSNLIVRVANEEREEAEKKKREERTRKGRSRTLSAVHVARRLVGNRM